MDALALWQLSHINGHWELTWDQSREEYAAEDDSFAAQVNDLMVELSSLTPPPKYHDDEDRLAEHVKRRLGWKIRKTGSRWTGADYPMVLEQGAFSDIGQRALLLAASGRIKAAMDRGQRHFDQMEHSHRKMLADVLAIVLYHRSDA